VDEKRFDQGEVCREQAVEGDEDAHGGDDVEQALEVGEDVHDG
jgi:hypothetical protein